MTLPAKCRKLNDAFTSLRKRGETQPAGLSLYYALSSHRLQHGRTNDLVLSMVASSKCSIQSVTSVRLVGINFRLLLDFHTCCRIAGYRLRAPLVDGLPYDFDGDIYEWQDARDIIIRMHTLLSLHERSFVLEPSYNEACQCIKIRSIPLYSTTILPESSLATILGNW